MVHKLLQRLGSTLKTRSSSEIVLHSEIIFNDRMNVFLGYAELNLMDGGLIYVFEVRTNPNALPRQLEPSNSEMPSTIALYRGVIEEEQWAQDWACWQRGTYNVHHRYAVPEASRHWAFARRTVTSFW